MSDLMNIFGAGGFDSITIKRAFELRDAALRYANNGWAVFPVHHILNDGQCSCGSDKCRDKQKYRGKHPVTHNGVLDATIDNDLYCHGIFTICRVGMDAKTCRPLSPTACVEFHEFVSWNSRSLCRTCGILPAILRMGVSSSV